MSLVLAQAGVEMARCQHDGHDLMVKRKKRDGLVYCSNPRCRWHRKPHPTNHWVNKGKVAA